MIHWFETLSRDDTAIVGGKNASLGEMIRARTGKDTHHGVFDTIDSQGNLILMTATGRLEIPAAEVFF